MTESRSFFRFLRLSPHRLGGILFLSMMLTAFAAFSAPPQVVDRIIAVVNDEIIVYQELNEMLAPMVAELLQSGQPPEKIKEIVYERRQRLLDLLIEQKLMLQATGKYEMNVSEKEVDAAIERMKKANKLTDEALRSALAQQGVSVNEFRNNYREQILLGRIEHMEVNSKIVISEEDIKAHYEAHADQFKGKREYHLRHLMVDAPSFAPAEERAAALARMEAAIVALKSGEAFVEVVKRYADRKYAEAEGELGFFMLDDLAPKLREAVETLAVGQYTPMIETGQGYQLIYLENIKDTPATSLADVADEIRERLIKETARKRKQDWLEDLRKQAHIKIIN